MIILKQSKRIKTFYMYDYCKAILLLLSCNKIGISSLKMAVTSKHIGAN